MSKYSRAIVVYFIFTVSGAVSGAQEREKFINLIKIMHENIYNAFNYREDDAIYNCLYDSFAGDELEKQFFEFLKTIRKFETEGLQNVIQRIGYDTIIVQTMKKTISKVYMKWRVYGVVKHEKHEHNRLNTYEAVYTLKKLTSDKNWRIINTRLINGERIIYPKRFYDPADGGTEDSIIVEPVNSPL